MKLSHRARPKVCIHHSSQGLLLRPTLSGSVKISSMPAKCQESWLLDMFICAVPYLCRLDTQCLRHKIIPVHSQVANSPGPGMLQPASARHQETVPAATAASPHCLLLRPAQVGLLPLGCSSLIHSLPLLLHPLSPIPSVLRCKNAQVRVKSSAVRKMCISLVERI